jgi:hypothetical protein
MEIVELTERQFEIIKATYETDGAVPAIKEARTITGRGLKETKQWIVDNKMVLDKEVCGCTWVVNTMTVAQMMGRLFELTAEIADIHRRLERL